MRLLVTGLGDIAHKAYLPVLSALPDVELHLATRNAQVLEQAGAAFGWRVFIPASTML